MNEIRTRPVPQNRDAERSLLASMMRDNRVIADVVLLVKSEHFAIYAHGLIFTAIVTLADKNKPADLVTIAEWLGQKKFADKKKTNFWIEEIGGLEYLVDLNDAAPSSLHYRSYAESVVKNAVKAKLILTCEALAEEAYDPSVPSDELLDSAERQILEVSEMGIKGDTVTVQEALTATWERIDWRVKNPGNTGVPTGFTDLDDLLCGLRDSELAILAARPSVGKSQLALAITLNAAEKTGSPILFTSLEQTRLELVERLLCSHGGVDSHHIRSGYLSTDEIERMMQANDSLSKCKILFDDFPGQNMMRVAANARRMKKKHGIKLMVIDYLQLIEPEDRRQPRHEQVGAISRRLKLLARELKIPVLALAQLNRESEAGGGSRPKLSHLGQSDNIGQDADTVILLHRQDNDASQPNVVIDVIVVKNRNGRIGDMKLVYEKPLMRFHNCADDYTPGYGAYSKAV